jgi:hypothetical protein
MQSVRLHTVRLALVPAERRLIDRLCVELGKSAPAVLRVALYQLAQREARRTKRTTEVRR